MWRGWPIVLVACGRVGFDEVGARDDGGPPALDAPADPTLLAYWPFDGSGVDATGHGYDATLVGASFAAGRMGQGLAVSSVPTYAIVPTLDAGALGSGDMTISLCVSAAANLSPYDMPFFMGGSAISQSGADFELGTNAWATSIKDGAGDADIFLIAGDETLTGTGFHCLAVRIDRTVRLADAFLDGTLRDSQDCSTLTAFPAGKSLRFGGNDVDVYPFEGVIDEVRIYTRWLSDTEIAALHAPP